MSDNSNSSVGSAAPASSTSTSQPASNAGESKPQGYSAANASTLVPESSKVQTSNPSQPAPKEPEYETLVLDGQEVRLTRDEVKKRAQLASAASKRFEEAVKLQKERDEWVKKTKSNPIESLLDPALGLTEDQVREQFEDWYRRRYIEPSRLSPEEMRARTAEEKLAAYERAQKEQVEQQRHHEEQVRLKKETDTWRETWQQRIIEGMTKMDLPKDELSIALIAQQLEHAARAKAEVPIEAAAGLVRDRLVNISKHFLGKLEGEALIKFVGDEIVNKIRKADLARLRAGTHKDPSIQSATAPKPSKTLTQGAKVVRMSDVDAYFAKLKD